MSEEVNHTPAYVLGVLVLATILGAGFKLANIITWPWIIVTVPLWAPVSTIFVLWVISVVLNKVFKLNQEQAVPLSVVR